MGTFDFNDIVAVFVCAGAAYFILLTKMEGGG